MTPWDVVEQALRWRKPGKDQSWLAQKLGMSAQAVTNWKTRGVPANRFRELANLFGLTVDQIEGIAPLPWEMQVPWPFSSELHARIASLEPGVIPRLEEAIWKSIERVESEGGISHAGSQRFTRASPIRDSNDGDTVELIDPLTAPERSRNDSHRRSKADAPGERQARRPASARKGK